MTTYTFKSKFEFLFKFQRKRCYICGTKMHGGKLNPYQATRDHVTPVSKGGKDHANVLLAHRRCNDLKANRLPRPCELIFLASANEAHNVAWRDARHEAGQGSDDRAARVVALDAFARVAPLPGS